MSNLDQITHSRKGFRMVVGISLIAMTALLSGCVGSSTYGTGKTQGAQLFEDINGIIPVGTKAKKPRIDYTSRPKLVKPKDATALPQPVLASATTNNANFPEDPESRRVRLRGEAVEAGERSGELPVGELTRVKEGAVYAKRGAPPQFVAGIDTTSSRDSTTLDLARSQQHRRKIQLAKSQRAGVRGAGPRRYLTEPPAEYRTPASTAAIGDIGLDEDEKAVGKKKKGFNWSKLNPFN